MGTVKHKKNLEHIKEVALVGDLILMRQEHLLGNLVRHPQNLMTKVCLTYDLQRKQQLCKRAGRTKFDWTTDNLKIICRKTYHEDSRPGGADQSAALKRDALSYTFLMRRNHTRVIVYDP